MLSVIIALVLLLYTAGCTLWAVFLRKLRKTRLRFFCVLASFVVALIATFIAKSFLEGEEFAMNTVIPLIASGDTTVAEFIASSEALRQTLIGTVSALLSPALFLVFFLVANFLSWIVYLFINLIKGDKMKQKDAVRTVPSTLGTIGFAIGKVILVIFVWMIPIISYVSLVPAAMSIFTKTDILPEEDRLSYEQMLEDYVAPVENDFTVKTYKIFGGGFLSDTLTTYTVGEERVSLTTEVGAIAHFGGCVIELTQNDFQDYDESDAVVFAQLSESFAASKTLPLIVSEIVYDATGAWMTGEAYMGVYYDSIRFDEEGMFDSFLDKSIEILHADTAPGRLDALKADIHTMFDVFTVLIQHGVFNNAENHDDLIYDLARDGTVPDLIAVLEKNESMKALVPEITAIGVSALGSALGSTDGEFGEVMDTVANELNGVKGLGTTEEQKAYVFDMLSAELGGAGLAVENSVIEKYADLMVDDLIASKGDEDITTDDVTLFFAEHAWEMEKDTGADVDPDGIGDLLDDAA